jgi:hypothetical protein
MSTSSLSRRLYAVFILVSLFILVATVPAQTVTGTISGTVIDSSGRVITGASVALVNERTGETRNVVTSDVGGFTFAALQPGTYTLKVEQRGFRQYERTGNVLPSSEHLSVGNIELSVGAVNEAVTTRAEGAVVQTESSEHSAFRRTLTRNFSAATSAPGRRTFRARARPGIACKWMG